MSRSTPPPPSRAAWAGSSLATTPVMAKGKAAPAPAAPSSNWKALRAVRRLPLRSRTLTSSPVFRLAGDQARLGRCSAQGRQQAQAAPLERRVRRVVVRRWRRELEAEQEGQGACSRGRGGCWARQGQEGRGEQEARTRGRDHAGWERGVAARVSRTSLALPRFAVLTDDSCDAATARASISVRTAALILVRLLPDPECPQPSIARWSASVLKA